MVASGCGGDKKDETPAEAPSPAAPAASPAARAEPGIALPTAAADEPAAGGEVGVKLPQGAVAPAEPSGLATRCTADVALPVAGCGDRVLGPIAVAGDHLYVAVREQGVRRYRIGGADGACQLTLDKGFGDGGTLANPEVAATGQKLDGPVYMRSGGPDYDLVLGPGGAVFMYDYLDGIHRIAGKKGPPRCTGVPGIKAMAFVDGKVLAARNDDLYTVAKGCKMTSPWKMPLRPDSLLAAGGALYASGVDAAGENRVFQLDDKGKKVWMAGNDDAFADDGLCWAGTLADCGDAVCVVDGNCKKVSRFARADGAFVGSWKMDALFGDRAYRVAGLVGAGDALWSAVDLRDSQKDQCEGAVFRMGSLSGGTTPRN